MHLMLLIFLSLTLQSCFWYYRPIDLRTIYQKDSGFPEMTFVFPEGTKLYIGRVSDPSNAGGNFVDTPFMDQIGHMVIVDHFNCVKAVVDGRFVLSDDCIESLRPKFRALKNVIGIEKPELRFVGGHQVMNRKFLAPPSYLCFHIVETQSGVKATFIVLETSLQLRVDATGEKVRADKYTPFIDANFCPKGFRGSATWQPTIP